MHHLRAIVMSKKLKAANYYEFLHLLFIDVVHDAYISLLGMSISDSAFIEKLMEFISLGPFDHTSSLIQDLGLAASHYLSSPTRQRMAAHKCCLEIFIGAFMMTLRSRSATQRDKKTTSVRNRISG